METYTPVGKTRFWIEILFSTHVRPILADNTVSGQRHSLVMQFLGLFVCTRGEFVGGLVLREFSRVGCFVCRVCGNLNLGWSALVRRIIEKFK